MENRIKTLTYRSPSATRATGRSFSYPFLSLSYATSALITLAIRQREISISPGRMVVSAHIYPISQLIKKHPNDRDLLKPVKEKHSTRQERG